MSRFPFGHRHASSAIPAALVPEQLTSPAISLPDQSSELSSPHTTVTVNLSIRDTPHFDDRIGEALCLMSPDSTARHDFSGAVVPIHRYPNNVSRLAFARLIDNAGDSGHLLDGFLEIAATVDLDTGEVSWQPEDGAALTFDGLTEVVENTFESIVDANMFGLSFHPSSIKRSIAVD